MVVASPTKIKLIEEVPDDLWEKVSENRGREDTDTDKKLMDGKTLFIEGIVSNYYQRADARGYRQKARKTTHKGKSGSLVKWERKSGNNNDNS